VDKPWLSRYPSDVPETINPEQYESLVEMFAFAAYLQNELKLQKGDRVALMMPNLLQYPVALFGILRAGCITPIE